MKIKIVVLVLIIIGLIGLNSNLCIAQVNNSDLLNEKLHQHLLPRPFKIDFMNGFFQLTDSTRIVYYDSMSTNTKSSKFIVDRFVHLVKDNADYLFQLNGKKRFDRLSIYLVNDKVISEKLHKTDESLPVLGDQSYVVVIKKESIKVSANSYRGLLWGMMTLKQIVTSPVVTNGAIPCMAIKDKPHYIWRGFQLDAGRAPFSMGLIKRMIRICSVFKLNQVYFREGDDELNAVKYDNLPIGHKNPGALTINQIKELIDYAEKYGMDFIPEIESLGHVSAKAFHYPALIEGGFEEEYWDGFSHTRKSHFKIDDPKTYNLLESIYDEWFAILKTPMVHLGLDEVRLPAEKQAKHLEKLLPLADKVGVKYGKEMTFLMWSDAPPVPEAYQDQVIRCLWEYGDGSEISLQNRHLINQGIKKYSGKNSTQGVIMACGSGSKHEPYLFTGQKRAYRNVAEWALFGKNRPNFMGIYAVQWHGNSVDLWVPNYLMVADLGWSPPDTMPDIASELQRIKMHRDLIRDAANPNPDEVDRPVWDGIWLDGNHWEQDIMTGEIAGDRNLRLERILREHIQPFPAKIEFNDDYFELTNQMNLFYSGNHEVQKIVDQFLRFMKNEDKDSKFQVTHLEASNEFSLFLTSEMNIEIDLQQCNESLQKLDEEGYSLLISKTGISLCANTNRALSKCIQILQDILSSPVVRYDVVPGMEIQGTM